MESLDNIVVTNKIEPIADPNDGTTNPIDEPIIKPKKPKPILYIGISVPEEIKLQLLEKIQECTEEIKTQFSTSPNKYMHHLTLQFGKKSNPEMWDKLLTLKDTSVQVTITHIVFCDKLLSFKCSLNDEFLVLCQSGIPHITIATSEGIKPFESVNIVKNMQEHKFEEFNFTFEGLITHF